MFLFSLITRFKHVWLQVVDSGQKTGESLL